MDNAIVLAIELGCKVGSLPPTYLRMPLGAHYKTLVAWDGVEERFLKGLTMLKRQYFSKGGESHN